MTRDEAIEIGFKRMRACDVYDDYSDRQIRDVSTCSADIAIALGMLKLDEPKSVNQRVKENWSLHESYLPDFLTRLDAAGLKIVEK